MVDNFVSADVYNSDRRSWYFMLSLGLQCFRVAVRRLLEAENSVSSINTATGTSHRESSDSEDTRFIYKTILLDLRSMNVCNKKWEFL